MPTDGLSRTRCCATIVTPDFLHKALTLRDSLARFGPIDFHILLVTDESDGGAKQQTRAGERGDVFIHRMSDVYQTAEIQSLHKKYGAGSDAVRWTSKSAFLCYLLESFDYAAAIYADCDVYFVDDPGFLFELLRQHHVVLTPHWRPISPRKNRIQYQCNFTDGLYNGGFVGAAHKGVPALRWWHKRCRDRCEILKEYGLYVDQKYLDLLPIYFDQVHVLRHKGCNVAEWNRSSLARQMVDGNIQIDGCWPLVFVHFTHLTIKAVEGGDDPVLEEVLAAYQRDLEAATIRVRELFSQDLAN